MTIKTILSAAILSGLVFTGTTDTTLANGVQSFKPIQGISFDTATKRAVAYFTNKAGQCPTNPSPRELRRVRTVSLGSLGGGGDLWHLHTGAPRNGPLARRGSLRARLRCDPHAAQH
jgi:hypothetical protein